MPHKKNLTINNFDVSVQFIERRIYLIRGHKVMIDFDLAELYGVPTKVLNQQVRPGRFPEDFMFQLSKEEAEFLKSQFPISKAGRGGRRSLPFAFTESELNRKFVAVIRKLSTHDKYFRIVFDELKRLAEQPVTPRKAIGFKLSNKA